MDSEDKNIFSECMKGNFAKNKNTDGAEKSIMMDPINKDIIVKDLNRMLKNMILKEMRLLKRFTSDV